MGRRYRSECITNVLFSQVRAGKQGPIVLNWLDIQDSFDASGFNLIIHEVAHGWTPVTAIAPAEFPLFRCVRLLAGNTIFMLQ